MYTHIFLILVAFTVQQIFASPGATGHVSVPPSFIFEVEPNEETPNGPWQAPIRIEGAINPVHDVDRFLLRLPMSGVWLFETFSGGCTEICSADTVLEIYSVNGTLLYHNDDSGHNLFCSAVQRYFHSGDYIVKVTTYMASSTTTWALVVRPVDGDWDGGCLADYFWSPSFTRTLDYGVAPMRFEGHIETFGAMDIYRIVIPYVGEWNFETFSSNCDVQSCELDTMVHIWDDSGFEFRHFDDDGGLDMCSRASLSLTPGSYLVVVNVFENSGTGYYDLVVRPSESGWDGSCNSFEPLGEIYYDYQISEVSTGFATELGLYWQAHVIDHDKGIAVHTTTDFHRWHTVQHMFTPGINYYWNLAALPTSDDEGYLVTYYGTHEWAIIEWKRDLTFLVYNSSVGTGDWLSPHMVKFNGKLHVLWSTNEPSVGGAELGADYDLVDVQGTGTASYPFRSVTTRSVNNDAATDRSSARGHIDGDHDQEPSKPVTCDNRLWVVWHTVFRNPENHVVDISSSALRTSSFMPDGHWLTDPISYNLDGALVHQKDLDCIDSTLILTLCHPDGHPSNGQLPECTITFLLRDVTTENTWSESRTNIRTTVHEFQDLAIGHTAKFAFIAWVSPETHIYYSWASTTDLYKWDRPRRIGGTDNEPLYSSQPSFACSPTACYLTYLVGGRMSRIIAFAACNDVSSSPCLYNGEVFMHLPDRTVPQPVVIIPGPTIVNPPRQNSTSEEWTEDQAALAIIIVGASILVILFVLAALTIGLMARNKSGCFAPMEYVKASSQEKESLNKEAKAPAKREEVTHKKSSSSSSKEEKSDSGVEVDLDGSA